MCRWFQAASDTPHCFVDMLHIYIKLVLWHRPKSVMQKSQRQCSLLACGGVCALIRQADTQFFTAGLCVLCRRARGFMYKHMVLTEEGLIPVAGCCTNKTHTHPNNPVRCRFRAELCVCLRVLFHVFWMFWPAGQLRLIWPQQQPRGLVKTWRSLSLLFSSLLFPNWF